MTEPAAHHQRRRSTREQDLGSDSSDVLIVGSGIAGLSTALELVHRMPEARILLLTRGPFGRHGASPLAQGGVAAAIDASDSPSLHARDTVEAGAGLGRREVVEILTSEGPSQIRRLIAAGARFDRDGSGALSLGLEGAHSRRRILHADGDRTGAEVTRALREAVRAIGRVRILEEVSALELLRRGKGVGGVLAEDGHGTSWEVRASHTVLATGGPGRVYLHTTAPPGLDGDGIAMAARAGAILQDLEFVQFHPTALNVDTDPLPLVTEALRGAGARLVDRHGHRVLTSGEVDELASRDQVARALWLRIRDGQEVYLDARGTIGRGMKEKFPGVTRLCHAHGIEPATELIPVTPAAHYHMGGIAVDSQGRSSLPGLWAVGEVASSGVHGANRLASNSLLEGLVFGTHAAQAIVRDLKGEPAATSGGTGSPEPPAGDPRSTEDAATRSTPAPSSPLPAAPPSVHDPRPRASRTLPAGTVERIRTLLWEDVGVVRNAEGLERALDELRSIEEEHRNLRPHARNLLLSARLITSAALARSESIGSHYRSDHPTRDPDSELCHSQTRLADGRPMVVLRAVSDVATAVTLDPTPRVSAVQSPAPTRSRM